MAVSLHLLPMREYAGVNRADPIRFYRWPVIGRLYRRRVEMCLAELSGGQRVLEVGFGTGVTFPNLDELYDEIHGIDLSADVRAITQLWQRHGIETHLRVGNLLQLPYPDEYFDSVLLISILEHLKPDEQPRAMSEIRRVLKPDGQMVYGVPVERPLMVFMFRLLGYNIREHHFSTEKDVASAARRVMQQVKIKSLSGGPLAGPVYEVGHFTRPANG